MYTAAASVGVFAVFIQYIQHSVLYYRCSILNVDWNLCCRLDCCCCCCCCCYCFSSTREESEIRDTLTHTHALRYTHLLPNTVFLTEAREYLLTLLLASFVFGTGFCNICFFLSSKP